MSTLQRRRWCRYCNRYTLHTREHFSSGAGCLLTLLTGGLFIILWLLIEAVNAFRPFRCVFCGKGNWL